MGVGQGCRMKTRLSPHDAGFVEKANVDSLDSVPVEFEALETGHVPLDVDVTVLDNTGSCKERVSRTYKGSDGDALLMTYLRSGGWCYIDVELGQGKLHCQKGMAQRLGWVLGVVS